MTACANGCTIRDQHLPDCDGTAVRLDGETVECRGCLPRPAEHGVLCARCWARLQSTVRTLPALVDHLELMARPSIASPSGAGGGGHRPPGPRSLYPEALGVADDLAAILASWCGQTASALALTAPPSRGLWETDSWDAVDAETGEAYRSDAVVIGVRDLRAVDQLVGWLCPHLDRVAEQEWAADLLDDLGTASARAAARWPVEEPARRVTDVRCPRCGVMSLVLYPPTTPGAPVQVACSRPECGASLSEDDWERARSWALAVARMATGAPAGAGR